MRPASLPPLERYKHGTRGRYVAGCRCPECRESNRLYYHVLKERALAAARANPAPASSGPAPQSWTAPDGSKQVRFYARSCPGVNGRPCPKGSHLRKDSTGGVCAVCRTELASDRLVPADVAREHLAKLSAAGVGRNSVQAACDLPRSSLSAIISGKKQKIRRSSEAKILAVDEGAVADHGTVAAEPTWKLLRQLLELGFTQKELAAALGSTAKTPALQLSRRRILARNAHHVAKVHRELTTKLYRELELRDERTSAAALGSEWFDAEAYSIIRRGL